MKSSRKFVLVLLVVVAVSASVVSPAAAATPEVQPPMLTCEGGSCQLGGGNGLVGLLAAGANVALTRLPFESTADGATQATLDVKKDITLSLPIGELTLTNASLQVEVDKAGEVTRLNGTADMPFPTFGLLDNVRVIAPAHASVGLDLGKNLPDTGFRPVPDRPYLFFSANTFMNLTGRAPGRTDDVALSFEPGQHLSLVVDTIEPVAYLNGQVTLSVTDQIALLGGLLESTPLGPIVPDTLPLRERTQYGLSGTFNKDVAASQMTFRGAYILDAGFLPAQLGVNAQLVNILGQLTLTRDGALVDGLLKSSIQPDKVFDGQLEVQTFIPFRESAGPSYASIDASARVPAAGLGVGAGALASAGQYELDGRVVTPFTGSGLQGRVSGKLPDVGGAVGSAAGAVGAAVGSAAGAVGTAASKAGQMVGSTASTATGFVGPAVGRAAESLGGYARFGRGLAENAINAGKASLGREGVPAPRQEM